MSGKYTKKKTAPVRKKRRKSNRGRVIALIIALSLLIVGIVFILTIQPGEAADIPTVSPDTTDAPTEATESVRLEEVEEISVVLNGQLEISDIGSYTGIYMEDGTDDIVSGILMMVVTNLTDETLQYAQIDMDLGDETAHFTLSTLPAGESAVVLEKNRMTYDRDADYGAAAFTASNVAFPLEPLSMYGDRLEIQVMDGVINVTNISGEDISGEISVYYKNSADDIYYGGITYVAKLKDGLKAGEIRQIMASHFNQPGSTIMFVTIVG